MARVGSHCALLALLLLLLSSMRCDSAEECCRCGKPFHRGHAAQLEGISTSTAKPHKDVRLLLPDWAAGPSATTDGMLGAVDVRADKSFYVAEMDSAAWLVLSVPSYPVGRQLVATVGFAGTKLPEEGETFEGEHWEKIRWQEDLSPPVPGGGPTTHWIKLPLKLRPGLRTEIRWAIGEWPLARHTGPGHMVTKGTVPIVVASSVEAVREVHAVRTRCACSSPAASSRAVPQ
jgi:hypothetical protein